MNVSPTADVSHDPQAFLPDLLMLDIFSYLPLSSRGPLASTSQHWKRLTETENYYARILKELKIPFHDNKPHSETFRRWADSKNFVILLDSSISMNLNEAKFFFESEQFERLFDRAAQKTREIAADSLEEAGRGVSLILFDETVSCSTIWKMDDLSFLDRIECTKLTEVENAIHVALNVHEQQSNFPKANDTEIHIVSDFDFDLSSVLSPFSNFKGEIAPRFYYHNVCNVPKETFLALVNPTHKRSHSSEEESEAKRICISYSGSSSDSE